MSGFDPDKFLQETAPGPKPFDPDAFLAATAPKGPPPGTPAQTKPLDQGDWRFKAGPAFSGTMPMIHGAKPGEGQLENEAPSTKVESPYNEQGKPSAVSGPAAALSGFTQGVSADFGDEAQGAISAASPDFRKSAWQQQTDQDLGPAPEKPWKERFVEDYTKGRDAGRRENAAGADQHPGYYGMSHLAGNIALAAANPVGGPAGGALLGGGMALGGSDAPLNSKEALYSTLGGAALGGTFGVAGKYLPKSTGLTLGGAGLGLGAFGDKIGMSDAQRAEAFGAGVLGLGGALLAGPLKGVANATGAGEKSAREVLTQEAEAARAKSLEGMDRVQAASKKAGLKQFEGISKIIDGQEPGGGSPTDKADQIAEFANEHKGQIDAAEKPYEKALQEAGKEKAKAFNEAVNAKQTQRAQQDQNTVKAARQAEINQARDDRELVQSLQNSERRPSAGTESEPPVDLSAQAQSRLGHEIKDFNADLRLMHGSDITAPDESRSALQEFLAPDIQARNKAYAEKLAAAGGKQGRLQQIMEELQADAAAKPQAAMAAEPGTDVVGPPKHLRADSEVRAPEIDGEPATPWNLDKDRATVAKDLKIDYPQLAKQRAAWPAIQEAEEPAFAARRKAIDRLLGVAPGEPGAPEDYSMLLRGDEKEAIRKNLGLFKEPKPKLTDPEIMRNYADIEEHDRGTPEGPGTLAAPADEAEAWFTARPKSADRDPSFYSGPRPEPDYLNSPISNADWKKVAGAHVSDAELSHDQRASDYWAKQPFTDSTTAPAEEALPKQPPGGFPSDVEEAVQRKIDAQPTSKLWMAKEVAKGIVRPLGRVARLVGSKNMDPAAKASVLGRMHDLASVVPNFQEKYGGLLNNASGVDDFVNRLAFIERQENQ